MEAHSLLDNIEDGTNSFRASNCAHQQSSFSPLKRTINLAIFVQRLTSKLLIGTSGIERYLRSPSRLESASSFVFFPSFASSFVWPEDRERAVHKPATQSDAPKSGIWKENGLLKNRSILVKRLLLRTVQTHRALIGYLKDTFGRQTIREHLIEYATLFGWLQIKHVNGFSQAWARPHARPRVYKLADRLLGYFEF